MPMSQQRFAIEEAVEAVVEDSLETAAWGLVLTAAICALPLAAAYAYGHVLDRVTPTPGFDPREQR